MIVVIGNNKIEVREMKTFFQKLKGFMFHLNPIEYGIRLNRCNSIHTYFMYHRIDIIMTDKYNRIIKIYKNFPSERIILPKKDVYYVYELPVTEDINILKEGEILQIEKPNHFTD
ncbi:MAG: DUF192 domain-containing protein [Bacilli bacterium]|nr:DUF192 domain-containing protein [Bacilli bacterium]